MPLSPEYHLLVAERGGSPIVAELTGLNNMRFGRRLDEMSDLSATVGVEGFANDDCCAALRVLNPWEHELLVIEGDEAEPAWAGPVGDPDYEDDQTGLNARDLFRWFERRWLPADRSFTATDLATIFAELAADALEPDDSPNIAITVAPTGTLGDRVYIAAEYPRVADLLRELARTSVDFTTRGRELICGGVELAVPNLPPLVTGNLIGAHVSPRGSEGASEVAVLGDQISATSGGFDERTGLVQQVFSESDIKDVGSLQVAADTRRALLSRSPEFVTGVLDPELGIPLRSLVPGARVVLDLVIGCREVVGEFRLAELTVTLDDSGAVSRGVTLEPLGTETE